MMNKDHLGLSLIREMLEGTEEKLGNVSDFSLVKKIVERIEKEELFREAIKKVLGFGDEELDHLLRHNILFRINGGILRLISGDQPLILKSTDGGHILPGGGDPFESFHGLEDLSWRNSMVSEMPIMVHEMIDEGMFWDAFKTLPGTWNQKALFGYQIKEFCVSFHNWLGKERKQTFFLARRNEFLPVDENNPKENLIVVVVEVWHDDSVKARYCPLSDYDIHPGLYRYRVVSPQLMLAEAKV